MYSKILVPVSGDPRDLKAVAKAVSFCSGEIILLHIEPAISEIPTGLEIEELEGSRQASAQAEGNAKIKPVVEYLKGQNVAYSVQIVAGTVANCISEVATKVSADLVVMFTDGVDSVSDFFLGSITQRVLESINVDLLALRK